MSEPKRTSWQRFRSVPRWVQVLAWLILPPVVVALWAASQPRQGRAAAWTLVALVTGAWISVASFGRPATEPVPSVETASPATPSDSATTTTAPTAPGATTTTMAPSGPPAASPAGLADQLTIAPEANADSYHRDLFGGGWVDADHDGCDTRCEVLEAERRSDLPGLAGGGWLSAYDGYMTSDASELEIDHVVALAEAWRSGASGWDPQRRIAYANDLDEPRALIAVTAATNGAKSDRDPSSWQPPSDAAWCEFATSWVTVKVRWGLTADQGEVDALRNMLTSCPGPEAASTPSPG